MNQQDTVKLLKECDLGIQMGISSIEEVLEEIKDHQLLEILTQTLKEHTKLQKDIEDQLHYYHQSNQEPKPWALTMSWLQTNVKLMVNDSDGRIAEMIIDGCEMGIKSLHRYLNQYKDAAHSVKEMVFQLIDLERNLTEKLYIYL